MHIKKRYAAGVSCVVILAVLAIYGIVGLPSKIDSLILERVWLNPDKVSSWGQNPGTSNTTTLRNYTFFNLTNPLSYFYNNQVPTFNEISGYLLQERTNFTKLVYDEEQSIVNFSIWNYFTELDQSRNLDEEVYALNLGPLGFWSQLESTSIVWFAIQAYGGVYYELSTSMKNQAIGQGLVKQYIKDKKALEANLCSVMNMTSEGCAMLWEDPLYGLSDQNHYQIWISWTLDNHTEDGIILAQYFGFTELQLLTFSSIFRKWCIGMRDIFQNWYCQDHPCTSYDFMILQMMNSSITNNPPSGQQHESICQTGNVTCNGWPQLYTFYKHVFLANNTEERFKGMVFSDKLVRGLFEPYRGVLLNVGNQSKLLQYGMIYQQEPQNEQNLAMLKATTNAQSEEVAIVVYAYFKYFVYQFGMKYSQGGSRKQTGYAQTFVKYLYKSFTKVYEWIKREYLSYLVAKQMGECDTFMRQIVEGISEDKLRKICKGVRKEQYRKYYVILEPCENQLTGRESLKIMYNLTDYQIGEYCDVTEKSVYTLLQQAHLTLLKHYNCTANKNRPRCTTHQLLLQQFFNSTISLHPLTDHLPSTTLNSHDSSLPAWQYRHYLSLAYSDPFYHKQQFSYAQAADLLSFDKLMSNPMIQNVHLDSNETKFRELFYWDNRQLLKGWIRYYLVEVAFGGLVKKKTVRELLFGYEDQFVRGIKQADLMRGGDPSRQVVISLNQPNRTQEEAERETSSMYTGKDDPYRVRQFITKDGNQMIHYKKNNFDGYQVFTQILSPFKQWLPINGTDGLQIAPLSPSTKLQYIYIDPTKRISQMQAVEQIQRYGFDCRRYQLTQAAIASSQINPSNDVFYQKFTGFVNASFKGAPLFISGNHFSRTDQNDKWASKVEIYDQSGMNKQQASLYDRSQLVVESKSGVLFTGTTYLQTNIYCQSDLIFPQKIMLPVFTVYRSGNMTQTAAEQLLGQLKIAIKLPFVLLICCLSISIVVALAMLWCYRRDRRVKRINQSLLQSWERHSSSVVQPEQQSQNKKEEKFEFGLDKEEPEIQAEAFRHPEDYFQHRLSSSIL